MSRPDKLTEKEVELLSRLCIMYGVGDKCNADSERTVSNVCEILSFGVMGVDVTLVEEKMKELQKV